MTNQCDEAFAVKRILDFAAREMCIKERWENKRKPRNIFWVPQETLFKANCLVPFCVHVKSPESLELASVIPTQSLRRPSYLIYPLLFPSPKTGVSVGCRRSPLYTLEFCWLDGAHSNPPSAAKASNPVGLHRLLWYGYEFTVNGLRPPPSLRVTHSHSNVTGWKLLCQLLLLYRQWHLRVNRLTLC